MIVISDYEFHTVRKVRFKYVTFDSEKRVT